MDDKEKVVLLRLALKGVADRKDGDGKPCWCITDLAAGLFVNNHAKWCLNARHALEMTD